jgi:hypothetical protein
LRLFPAIVFAGALAARSTAPAAHSEARATGAAVPQNLTCESRQTPLSIDTGTPHFAWTLRPDIASRRDVTQSAYRILVARSREVLMANRGDLWDSAKAHSPSIFGITYAGKPLCSRSRYYWKAQVWDGDDAPSEWSAPAEFTTGVLRSDEWIAHWVAAEPDTSPQLQTRERVAETKIASKSLPIFRHEFRVNKRITEALLFVSGLGQYEVHLNGRGIGDAVLRPGWTDYRKRVFYNTYEVTGLVHQGRNAIGVMLGNGMYNVEGIRGRYTKFVGSFGQPKFILQMHLRFADGTETIVTSNKSWKTTSGPIVYSSIYGGEDFDARREPAGWDIPGFSALGWMPALEVNGPGGKLVSEPIPAVHVSRTYEPVSITQPKPGLLVYDLGQNFSGWPDIAVQGEAGSSIKIVAGELLDSDGLVTQHSANASPQSENSFTYILKGHGLEHWHPRFSYYGFRYVQVERFGSPPPIVHSLRGQFIHARVRVSGLFSSSNPLFGRIHNLIDTAILSNMMSVLTDCPHREKLGWLEQSYLAGASIMYNYDVSVLYQKISDDMQDEQQSSGMVPSIAPEYVAFLDALGNSTSFRDSPEWGSAVILSPWAAYQFYGDIENLRAHYESMKDYAEYLCARTTRHMLAYGLGDWYDIGPKPPGESQLTAKGLTATAIYYQDLTALSQVALLLGKVQEASKFSDEAAAVKSAFNAQMFHSETDDYDLRSQTADAMPLVLDLVPEGHRPAVLANLIADIRRHANHVTAGDIGFQYVVRALSEAGRSDVVYDILSRSEPPSYGSQLARGATTLTEAWDANPNESQNHFMLGHADEWFYRSLGGIDFDLNRAPDERIRIEPAPVGDVSAASVSFDSRMGLIDSAWSRSIDGLRMDITVPPGATATVRFPPEYSGHISEKGMPLSDVHGVHEVRTAGYSVNCVLGSGVYHFTARP